MRISIHSNQHYGRLLGIVLALLGCTYLASSQSFDYATFRQQVFDYHPLIRQGDLYIDQAQAAMFRAKGGFDPVAFADHSRKQFNGKTYFEYTEAGLKLPTWAGLELKGAYNLASGTFLNQENALPTVGQASFGLNWTLGQGLFFDERRANLQLARVGLEMGEAERRMTRNAVMFDAAKSYWSWNFTENALIIISNALEQAAIRHEGLRASFFQGERAAIDTLETFIQVQIRLVEIQFAQLDAQNAALELSTFLWTDDQQTLASETIPAAPLLLETDLMAPVAALNVEDLLETARSLNPELRMYAVKLRQLEIERRLKNEKRKPVLDIDYYLLGNGWQFFPTATAEGPAMLANDVKWGLHFSYPIPNRKARGDYQITQIKIVQNELALQQKQQDVTAKVRQYANEVQNFRTQTLLFQSVTTNYRRLLDAENEKFFIGESSVFLVNIREQNWLDAQLKYLKLLAEMRKAEAGLQWAVGILGE